MAFSIVVAEQHGRENVVSIFNPTREKNGIEKRKKGKVVKKV
jgi:predicted ribosome-associated RNA-binding protein Tma20